MLLWASKLATAKIECNFEMGSKINNTTFGGIIYFAVDGTTYVSYLFDLFLIDDEFTRKITGAAHLCYMRKIINRLMMNRKKENDSYQSDSIQSL